MKRILSLLLPLALLLSIAAQAVDGSPVFARSRVYEGQFSDVGAKDWYYGFAVAGYEYGLFNGQSDGRFAPDADITVAELVTLSARLRAAYEGEAIPAAAPDEAWYAPCVTYLRAKGVFDAALAPYLAVPATRAQLADVFAASLPGTCYDGRNDDLVTDAYASGDYITDVSDYTPYQPQILWLYRQGLVGGEDDAGSFAPEDATTRAETAAVVARIVDPSLRVTLDWVVPPYRSAVGATFAGLVEAPERYSVSPDLSNLAEVDAATRRMLSSGESVLAFRYASPLTERDAQRIAQTFTERVKTYCEQMYNSVLCQVYSNGSAYLTFSAMACTAEQLEDYREQTLARAIEVHDALWESGQLTADMSEYDKARVYYVWICDNCAYDYDGANSDESLSHLAYNALIHRIAVCDGYTGAYNLFLKLEGIDCTCRYNDTHIWTVATLDGTEYHIDTTWGDQTGRVDMSYFGMSEAQSYARHPW